MIIRKYKYQMLNIFKKIYVLNMITSDFLTSLLNYLTILVSQVQKYCPLTYVWFVQGYLIFVIESA